MRTNRQVSDLLSTCASDDVEFGHRFLNWHAFPEQAKWLRQSNKPINICRAGNRWGKTESLAIRHLRLNAFKVRDSTLYDWDLPYQTVNTSLSLDQATLPLRKAWQMVNRPAGHLFRDAFIKRFVRTPFPRIEFKNGSVWWARSTTGKGKYLEGHDFDYVSNDEGAFDPDLGYILDEVLLIRLLDRGGQIDLISTGRRGSVFNKRFNAGIDDPYTFTFQGRTLDNPNLNKASLSRLMASLSDDVIAERFEGGERSGSGRIPNEWVWYAMQVSTGFSPRLPQHRYVTAWDLAQKRNFVAGVTLDITKLPYQVVAWEMFNEITLRADGVEFGLDSTYRTYWDYVYDRIRQRHAMYGGLCLYDGTGMGAVVGDAIAETGATCVLFTPQIKAEIISALELGFGMGGVGLPDLSMVLPDMTTWDFQEELDELDTELSGLDTATALGLCLWSVRSEMKNLGVYRVKPRLGYAAA